MSSSSPSFPSLQTVLGSRLRFVDAFFPSLFLPHARADVATFSSMLFRSLIAPTLDHTSSNLVVHRSIRFVLVLDFSVRSLSFFRPSFEDLDLTFPPLFYSVDLDTLVHDLTPKGHPAAREERTGRKIQLLPPSVRDTMLCPFCETKNLFHHTRSMLNEIRAFSPERKISSEVRRLSAFFLSLAVLSFSALVRKQKT